MYADRLYLLWVLTKEKATFCNGSTVAANLVISSTNIVNGHHGAVGIKYKN